MEDSQYQQKVIDLLILNEELIGHLYEIYSRQFKEHEEFWKNLSSDEFSHSGQLASLKDHIGNGKIFFRENSFKCEAVESSVKYVEGKIDDAQSDNFSLVQALSIALDLEDSLLEKNYYNVAESDSVEFNHLISKIISDEKIHRESLRAMWKGHSGK